MRIYIGYDHNGTKLAFSLMEYLVEEGHEVNEPFESQEGDDYPDIADAVCEQLKNDKDARAILICGTGIGIAMAANRKKYIRAVLAKNDADAYFARRHEDANVLVLAAGYSDGKKEVKSCGKNVANVVNVFLTTEFEGGRHSRRVNKLENI